MVRSRSRSRSMSMSRTAVGIFLGACMSLIVLDGCKGRDSQTIEINPVPPKAPSSPSPSANGTGSKPAPNPSFYDQFDSTPNPKPGNPASSAPVPVGQPPVSAPPTGPNASPGTTPTPGPSPVPSPSPSVPPTDCDRSNSDHFGTGYGSPFEQNGAWMSYADRAESQPCKLAVPHCSARGGIGYGDKFCKGILTLAKDVDPSDGQPHNDSICVVKYGPSCP